MKEQIQKKINEIQAQFEARQIDEDETFRALMDVQIEMINPALRKDKISEEEAIELKKAALKVRRLLA